MDKCRLYREAHTFNRLKVLAHFPSLVYVYNEFSPCVVAVCCVSRASIESRAPLLYTHFPNDSKCIPWWKWSEYNSLSRTFGVWIVACSCCVLLLFYHYDYYCYVSVCVCVLLYLTFLKRMNWTKLENAYHIKHIEHAIHLIALNLQEERESEKFPYKWKRSDEDKPTRRKREKEMPCIKYQHKFNYPRVHTFRWNRDMLTHTHSRRHTLTYISACIQQSWSRVPNEHIQKENKMRYDL